eukprot:TRINITY_DN118462_c0_g1_i1.p1 TRINITY_DN118462_c0_g1~~TRINITY_DN118462_c0_g1_i1.p1  ORF type:complete len:127 (+),score=20.19 TRINITY_DN118462_c0_g1_i1:49-429(+)
MPADSVSAAKLEKKLSRLETALRADFERLIAEDRRRLHQLEQQIGPGRARDISEVWAPRSKSEAWAPRSKDGESAHSRVENAAPAAVVPCEGSEQPTSISHYNGQDSDDHHYDLIPFIESAWNLVL